MPIAHSEVIDFLKLGLDTSFFKMFDSFQPAAYEATMSDVATVIPSITYENKYAALGNTPGLTRRKGDIVLDGINYKMSYTIENHNYENPIEISENDVKNDQYGQILMRAGELGMKARGSIDQFAFDSIHNGGTAIAYDEKTVYASNHTIGSSGTIDNDHTLELSKTNLQTMIATMQKYKDDRGQPARITPDLLLVGPALFPTAWEIVYGTSLIVTGLASTSSGSVAPNANAVASYGLTVKYSSFFTSDTEWYLLKTKGVAVKPIIVQEREPVSTEMSDVDLFKKGLYYYKGKWYGETGYYDFRNILRGNA